MGGSCGRSAPTWPPLPPPAGSPRGAGGPTRAAGPWPPAHRAARDEALRGLAFPMPAFRTGQRELAEAVYRAARAGRCLMAQAPTGIGKTLGTIFPMLKASAGQGLDKVFFLTAKGTGHGLALQALATINGQAADKTPSFQLRVLDVRARDKACEHPDKACHGNSCPLASGFYDRLPQAREAATRAPQPWDASSVRTVALEHQVCPYYLAQELVRWSDVVVADYHYYYDTSAMLYALTKAQQWRVGVLVDEAHNLCLLYTSPSPRDRTRSRMPSSA